MKLKPMALAVTAAAALLITAADSADAGSLKAYRHIVLDGFRVKWGPSAGGTGALVTYATLEAAVRFPGARNCGSMAPMAPLLAANRVAGATFEAELRAAFDQWSAVADIRFEPAPSPAAADILIGAQAEPRGRAFTNVEIAETPGPGGIGALTRSLICLNPETAWKVGFDGDLDVYDLRYTLLHEIGHAIGLDHPAIANVLMDFRYLERFRAPQPGDREGIVALYGPSQQPWLADGTAVRRIANVKDRAEGAGG